MVTGPSTADLAIILVDARKGLQEQSRRHATIASLLQVPHVVLAVNKMDLVDWSQEVFEEISSAFVDFAAKLGVCRRRHDSGLRPCWRQRGDTIGQHGLVQRRLAHAPPRARLHRK